MQTLRLSGANFWQEKRRILPLSFLFLIPSGAIVFFLVSSQEVWAILLAQLFQLPVLFFLTGFLALDNRSTISQRWKPLFLHSLLKGFLVFLGLALFFFPGIFLLLVFACSEQLVSLRGVGPLQAFKQSYGRSRGHRWQIFTPYLLLFVLGGLLFWLAEALLRTTLGSLSISGSLEAGLGWLLLSPLVLLLLLIVIFCLVLSNYLFHNLLNED